jgi:DNA-binding MarR family transcriptional regulator
MKTPQPTPLTQTRPSLRLDEQLCFSLYSTTLAMNKLYRSALKTLDLTYPQYLVMLVLWEQDQRSVSAIGEELFLDSATLTPLLKRMEKAGLLSRTRAVADERSVIIALTDQGKALRAEADAVLWQIFCSTGLSAHDVSALRDNLKQLRGQLLAAG